MKKSRTIPFRIVLPIAELVICGVLLWPLAGFLYFQIRSIGNPSLRLIIETRQPAVNITLSPADLRALRTTETRLSLPALLNIPCAFLGLARNATVPKAMLPAVWRAISWPVIGVIFWWIVGRSIDALSASRRRVLKPNITWAEVLFAVVVIGFNALLCAGFLLDPSMRDEFIYPWGWAVVACAFWSILASAIIAARVAQRRIKRSAITDMRPISAS